VELLVADEFPVSRPQQYASCPAVTAQVRNRPAVMEAKIRLI
jgi:hypothetical protein